MAVTILHSSTTASPASAATVAPPSDSSSLNRRSTSSSAVFSSSHPYGGNNLLNRSTISGSPASGISSSSRPRLASSSPHSSTTPHTGVLPYSPPFGSELRKSLPSSSRAVRASQDAIEVDTVEDLDSRNKVAGRPTNKEVAVDWRSSRPAVAESEEESSSLPQLGGDDVCWRRVPTTQPSAGYSLSSHMHGRVPGVASSSTVARLTDDDAGMRKYARRTCNSEPPGFTSATHHRSDRNNGVDYHRPSATAPQGTKAAAVMNGKAQRSRHGVSRGLSRHQLPRLAPSQPQTPSTSPGRRRPKSSSADFCLGSAPPLLDEVVQQPRRSSSYSSGIEPRTSLASRAGRLWTPNDLALLSSGVRRRAAVRQVGVVVPYEERPSGEVADDSSAKQQQSDDDHDDTQAGSAADRRSSESRMDARVRSLPAVVCKSASGDVILMETRNIQNLRIQREYGKEGQRLARSRMQTELSTPRALAADAWRQGHMDVGLITKRPTPADIRAIGERAGWGSELEGMPMEEAQRYMVEARDRVDEYYRRVTEGGAGRNSNNKPSGLRNASGPRDGGDDGHQAEEITRRHYAKGLRVVHGNSWIAARRSNDAVSCSQSIESTEQDGERGGGANGKSHFDETALPSRPADHYTGHKIPPTSAAPHHAPRKDERPIEAGSSEAMMRSDGLVCLRDKEAQARRLAMRTERWREASSHSRHGAPRKQSSSNNSSYPCGTPCDALPSDRKRRGMWKKLQQSAQLKAADDVIGALQRRDAFSLKAAAEERRRRREEIAAEWGREQAREISSLVPPPAELPDEDIPPRSAQLSTSRSRGVTATGEPDPDTTQELKQFQELEAAVAEHEDFHWSGGFGTLSKRRNDGRVVWKAVCEANEAAFDEEQAMELEEQARKTSEAARTLGDLMDEDPVNRGLQAKFKRSVKEVHSQRPYFQTPDPGALKVRHRRMPWQRANGEGEPSPQPAAAAWRLEDSIFSQRAKESDARSFLNTPKLTRMQVEMDWGRVIAKSRFQKMLRKAMGHSVTDDGNHEAFKQALTELEEVVLIRYPTIRSSFLYYCARSSGIGEVSFSLLANQWSTFCRETGITDPSSGFCSPGSLNSLFVATNFEEGGAMSRAEDVENDDNALMRFEWVEILIRVAIGKYIHEQRATDDVREAFVMLCDEHLSQLPPEAVLDCNEFRQHRLYTPAVDSLLRGHHSLFKAIFKVYKAKDSAKWFGMEHWVAFLESLDLVGGRGGIGLTHAKLLFMWSQMDVIDELRRRQRVVGWSFTDFLEGIARLADALPLPSVEELEELREEREFKLPGKLAYWEYYRRVLRARARSTTATGDGETNSGDVGSRASSATGRGQATFTRSATQRIVFAGSLGGVDPPSAPLEERLDALLHLMIAGLSEVWNVEGADSARLAEKLGTMATFLSGGIEVGF